MRLLLRKAERATKGKDKVAAGRGSNSHCEVDYSGERIKRSYSTGSENKPNGLGSEAKGTAQITAMMQLPSAPVSDNP